MRPAPPTPPPISGHQDTLDGLRAVAALAVLVYHVASTAGAVSGTTGAGWLYNGGQVGVPIFFTLSGLLLYRPWAAAVLDGRKAPKAREYFRKRALRILPAYWAVIVCFMLTAGRGHIGDPVTWGSLLTLTQTYLSDPWWKLGLGPPELGQAWSLVVEVSWYLALPLTAAVLGWYARRAPADDVGVRARRLLYGIGAYAALSLPYTAVMFLPGHRHPQMGLWLPRFFCWFAIGMALAVVTVWARLDGRRPVAALCRAVADSWAACWTAAAMLYVVASTPVTGPITLQTPDAFWTSVFDLVLNGLCAAALVAPVALAPAGHPALGAILGNPVMRFLGRISYGLFLWQMLIIVGWYEATDRAFRGEVLTDLPLMAAASIAAATLSYYLVEWPVQRLTRRRRGRPRPDRGRPDPGRPDRGRPARDLLDAGPLDRPDQTRPDSPGRSRARPS
ncbi:acyltransferase family protein [Actinomadura fibrosa]|uniref:Acyltransferase family protein n=1 Tax=Actinomadura fibrosa TaxID=111802 RepID=A0ABW2XI05_9ACTN|nr:acyltransferase [Actinomadura fibrosa]